MGLAEEQNVRQKSKPSIVEFEKYIYMHMYNSMYKIKIKKFTKQSRDRNKSKETSGKLAI